MYSDEGGYIKDGGEEVALYEEDDGGLYEGEEDGLYEDDEIMYDDEDLYNLDGTLSEDTDLPFTPTPTSTAPATLDVPSSRPPLEKQSSVNQQQPPTQPSNQTSNQTHPPGAAPTAQPASGQPTPPKQAQTQPPPQSAPSATSFFSMAKPLTAAVTGLASTFLSSVPTAQPAQPHPPASAGTQQHQSAAASCVPPSHPATVANSTSQSPCNAAAPSSQQTPSSAQSQSQLNDSAATQSVAPEDQDPYTEEEQWPEEEGMFEKEAVTPPAQPEESFALVEKKEEQFEDDRPQTPTESEEVPAERYGWRTTNYRKSFVNILNILIFFNEYFIIIIFLKPPSPRGTQNPSGPSSQSQRKLAKAVQQGVGAATRGKTTS